MTYAPTNIRMFASARETSVEIALAIFEIADEGCEDAVWTEPTADQQAAIVARAWELADADETSLCWGNETFQRAA